MRKNRKTPTYRGLYERLPWDRDMGGRLQLIEVVPPKDFPGDTFLSKSEYITRVTKSNL